MKSKSLYTAKVAQDLINKGYYTSSVHSSYYSVLQMMKFLLANVKKNPVPYEKQAEKHDVGMHEYILREIEQKLAIPPHQLKKFKEEFRDLKNARVRADYSNVLFSQEESAEWKSSADGLISKLNNYFNSLL